MSIFFPTISMWFLIILSFLGGWVLMLLQLPIGFNWFGYYWVILILLYWVLMKPQYVNVGVAWLVGVSLDIIYNFPVGEHALALVLVVFFIVEFHRKLMLLGFFKMSLVIFGLIMFYQFLLFLLQAYLGNYFNPWSILSGAIASALIWPLLALLLFNYQQKLRI